MKLRIFVLLMIILCAVCTGALADFIIPENTTVIEEEAFMNNKSISNVILPKGLLRIESKAFANCNLMMLVFPPYRSSSLSYIADNAFIGNSNMKVIAYPGTYAYNWAKSKGFISTSPSVYWKLPSNKVTTSGSLDDLIYFLMENANNQGYFHLGMDIDGELDGWVNIGADGYVCADFEILGGKLSVGSHTVELWISDDNMNKTVIDSASITVTKGKDVSITTDIATDPLTVENNQTIELPFTVNATNANLRRIDIWAYGENNNDYVQLMYRYVKDQNIKSYSDTLSISYDQFSADGDYTVYCEIEAANGSSIIKEIPLHVGTIQVPNPPEGVALTTAGNTITVSWDPVDDALNYRLYYGTGTSITSAVEIDLTGHAVFTAGLKRTYTINNLNYSKKYYVWVKAENAAGLSDASTRTYITTETNKPVISSIFSTGNTIHVQWNEIVGSNGYEVSYSTSSSFTTSTTKKMAVDGSDNTSADITELEYNKTYYVKVAAVINGNTGTASAYKPCKTESAPEILTVDIGNNNVAVTAGNETIRKFVAPSAGTYVFTTTGSEDTKGVLYNASMSKLAESDDEGEGRNFKIEYTLVDKQVVYIGVSFWYEDESGAVTLVVDKKCADLEAPDNLEIESIDDITVTVSWDAVNGATGYKVTCCTNLNDVENSITVDTSDELTAEFTELEHNQTYYIYAVAYSEDGESDKSEPIVFTVAPEKPQNIYLDSLGNTITVSWSRVNGAVNYTIYYGLESNWRTAQIKNAGNNNRYVLNNLDYDTRYYIWVTATNEQGSESIKSTRDWIRTDPEPIKTVSMGNNNVAVEAGKETVSAFVAPSAGTYVFTTIGSKDTEGTLYDASMAQIAYNDEDGEGNNFKIEYALTSGQTVYIGVKYYNSSVSGTETLNISKQEWTPSINGALTKTEYIVAQNGSVSVEGRVQADNCYIGRISVSIDGGEDRALTKEYANEGTTDVDLSDIFTITPSTNLYFSNVGTYSITVYAKAYGSDNAVEIGSATVTVTPISDGFTTSSQGLNYIKQREGLRLTAYLDPVGKPTIGYGHTSGVTQTMVNNGYTITQTQAEEYLRQDLAGVESTINSFIKNNGITLTQNQFDALVSFSMNAGTDYLLNSGYKLHDTLIQYKNASNIPISKAFRMIGAVHHGDNKCIAGLFYRRCDEGAMFYYGTYQCRYDWSLDYSWWGTSGGCANLMPDDWYPKEYGYTETPEPDPLTIFWHPSSQTVTDGDSVTFSVTATGGTGSYTYQWYRASSNTATGTKVSTSRNYSFTASSTYDGYYYYCVVTSGSEMATSNRAKLTVTEVDPVFLSDINVSGGTYDGDTYTMTFDTSTSVSYIKVCYKSGSTIYEKTEEFYASTYGNATSTKISWSIPYQFEYTGASDTRTVILRCYSSGGEYDTKTSKSFTCKPSSVADPSVSLSIGTTTMSSGSTYPYTYYPGDTIYLVTTVANCKRWAVWCALESDDNKWIGEGWNKEETITNSTQKNTYIPIPDGIQPGRYVITASVSSSAIANDPNAKKDRVAIYINVGQTVEPVVTHPSASLSSKLNELETAFPGGKYWTWGNDSDTQGYELKTISYNGKSATFRLWSSSIDCKSKSQPACQRFVKFKDGSYGGIASNAKSSNYSNSYGLQCFGFANMISWGLTGEVASQAGTITYATNDNRQSLVNNLVPGDVLQLRAHPDTGDGHTAVVIDTTETSIKVVDCNWDHKCGIRWNGSFSRSVLSGTSGNFLYWVIKYESYK